MPQVDQMLALKVVVLEEQLHLVYGTLDVAVAAVVVDNHRRVVVAAADNPVAFVADSHKVVVQDIVELQEHHIAVVLVVDTVLPHNPAEDTFLAVGIVVVASDQLLHSIVPLDHSKPAVVLVVDTAPDNQCSHLLVVVVVAVRSHMVTAAAVDNHRIPELAVETRFPDQIQ